MYEIKFRGKRIDNGEWVYGNLLKLEHENHNDYFIIPFVTNGSRIKTTQVLKFISPCYEVDSDTVSQYTGLRDCKRTEEYPEGQEVYESDIIFFSRNSGVLDELPETAYMEVTFERGCFWGENTDWQEPLFELIDDGGIYVRGNVFNNPELAEQL